MFPRVTSTTSMRAEKPKNGLRKKTNYASGWISPKRNTQKHTLKKRTRTRQTERERITESAKRHSSCYWELMLRKNLLPAKLCCNSPLAMKWSLYIAHQSAAKSTEKKRRWRRRNRNSPQLRASERESERGVQERRRCSRRCSRATKLTPYDSWASWLLRLRLQFEL